MWFMSCVQFHHHHPHRLRSVQVALWLSPVSCIHMMENLVIIGSVLREFICCGWIRLVLIWRQTPDIRYQLQITVSSLWLQHSWMKMTTESGDVGLLSEIKSRPQSDTLSSIQVRVSVSWLKYHCIILQYESSELTFILYSSKCYNDSTDSRPHHKVNYKDTRN